MSILNQKTINSIIEFEGVSLHKGKNVKMKIKPSSPNSGITFRRVDLKKNNIISANFFNVKDAVLCTTLSNEAGVSVSTVEHLMAAFYGLGVDNAEVEIDQDELPIMDGSSKHFVNAIEKSGLKMKNTNSQFGGGRANTFTKRFIRDKDSENNHNSIYSTVSVSFESVGAIWGI